MSLNLDDPTPPYVQLSRLVRAAILTRKPGFQPGDKIVANQLVKDYGVSRNTASRALELVKSEGLLVTRSGSGSYVRERTERPVGLRPHLEIAFAEPQVTLDFSGFSSETLYNAMQEPLDKIRSGQLAPESIKVRLLLPDTSSPMGVPVLTDGLHDEPALRERARNIAETNAGGIAHSVEVLAELGLVQSASVQVKVHRATSLFKLYILNHTDVFFGFYPLRERTVEIGDASHTFFDVTGKDTTLFHHSTGPDDASLGSLYVQQAQTWFDSVWSTIAYERKP